MAAPQPWPGHQLFLPGALPCTPAFYRAAVGRPRGRQPGGRAGGGAGVGVHARTAEQHREDGSRGGNSDPSAASRLSNEAEAKAMGLQGGERCPGCDGEECTVHKVLEGGGSDGGRGCMIGEKCLYRRNRRTGGRAG
jgi:hypothetical protein